MLTDTHCHLDFPEFAQDFEGVLARAAEAGVSRLITIGTSVEGSRRALSLAHTHPQIWSAVGIHPNSAHEVAEGWQADLRSLARQPRVAAIGEAGMDFYWLPSAVAARGGQAPTHSEDQPLSEADIIQKQEEVFRAQLDLAVETGLHVVIHQRASWDATLSILREYTGRVRAVFHCFGEDWSRACTLFDLGHLVSFTGIVTFKNAPLVQDVVRRIAPDHFMVETDAPYLAPIPHRGKRCEPAFVRRTAEFIAELRGQALEEIAASTEATAERFYRLSA